MPGFPTPRERNRAVADNVNSGDYLASQGRPADLKQKARFLPGSVKQRNQESSFSALLFCEQISYQATRTEQYLFLALPVVWRPTIAGILILSCK